MARARWLVVAAMAAMAILGHSTRAAECYDKPGWHSPQNDLVTCSWFAAPPKNDEYNKCSTFNRAFDVYDGHTASSACCTCGGGCRPAILTGNDPSCNVSWVYTGTV
ncbi:hypothetical protein GUITHDRAFT_163775 [Guillardia theta CCMP2712]|uniref:Uncharacterized protein n=2 Tax=Guillardia theta TaxID=55529 RepID=L1J6Z4_GUITC|nr:hypothetical protein GUITHDRAFT_163775 [Guillardia theta CCMP2712]EKX43874.1 hypothetical protein GUITHDRAFT_163775 [Guillardia theta CCMP2712]|eukprot:XP_005830854.1 hypothetical protein GUITHDRAFT_163775 [Guillardia theta CCMP2712]